ncbi:MAG: type I 3-dehydroquinate dehydratase [Bacteroidales bacterium]|nr:type I 3-dehydroquinate dehydratase [Bacteroidales bacterium]
MICVAISDKDPQKCLELLNGVEMAEIRLDLTGFDNETIKEIFSKAMVPCIATCRPDNIGYEKQEEILKLAIASGAAYVDIETEAPQKTRDAIIAEAKKQRCKVIVSYHNFESTPGIEELHKIAQTCYLQGADVAKVVSTAKGLNDAAKILSLYSVDKPIVALAMGEEGKITRLMAPLLGAEFTFAATNDGTSTAPGQITYEKMTEARRLFAKFMI